MVSTGPVDTGHRRYKEISRLFRRISSLQSDQVTSSKFTSFHIDLNGLPVDDTIDFKSDFCVPIPDEEFDGIYDSTERSHNQFPEKLAKDVFTRSMQLAFRLDETFLEVNGDFDQVEVDGNWDYDYRSMWRGLAGPTKKCRKRVGGHPPWEEMRLIHPINRSFSHRACILRENAIADDCLRRRELLVALEIMKKTLHLPRYQKHHTIPIFLYSVFANGVRIVHVHFNGRNLMIHKSRLLDISGNEEDLKLCLRWMMGRLVGSTKIKTSNPWKNNDGCQNTSSSHDSCAVQRPLEDELADRLQDNLQMPSTTDDSMDMAA